jgi:hypothetical protein
MARDPDRSAGPASTGGANPRAADHGAARVRAWKCALLLAVLSTLLKLCVLVFPSQHVSPGWILAEEQHRGNVAMEVLRGPLLPIQDYHWTPREGGSLVVGLLAAPCLAVFGDSIASVRLVPIAFNAVTVAILFLILDRFVSRRAAWIGGVLIAFAPPGYVLVSITAWGTHVENNALVLLGVFAFLLLQQRGPRETLTAVLFGVCTGFSLYFGYLAAVTIVAIGIHALLRDRLFFARPWFRRALLGFAIGFAPWLTYNLGTGFRGLMLYGNTVASEVSIGGLLRDGGSRSASLLFDQLPNLFFLGEIPGLRGLWAGRVVEIVFLALTGFLAWSSRGRFAAAVRGLFGRGPTAEPGVQVLFLLDVAVFVLVYASANTISANVENRMAHEGRYLTALYPFLVMCVACALDLLLSARPRQAALWRAIPASLAALFVVGTLAVCDRSRTGESFRRPGTSEARLAQWYGWTWRTDRERLDRIVRGLAENRPPEVADGTIFMIAQALKWGIRVAPRERDDPDRVRVNTEALHYLHERVEPQYKLYCEPPREGEPFFGHGQRDQFRAWYAAQR